LIIDSIFAGLSPAVNVCLSLCCSWFLLSSTFSQSSYFCDFLFFSFKLSSS